LIWAAEFCAHSRALTSGHFQIILLSLHALGDNSDPEAAVALSYSLKIFLEQRL
jgi:hypothetical protein